jgi:hypothetical protein
MEVNITANTGDSLYDMVEVAIEIDKQQGTKVFVHWYQLVVQVSHYQDKNDVVERMLKQHQNLQEWEV